MNIRWKLRMAAAQREVWTGTQLRRLLAEKAGLELSAASVSALFTKEPAQVKLSTLAALCTALECTPNDLFEVDTTPVARPAPPAAPGDGPAEGRPGPGPVDAAPLTGPAWERSSGTAPGAARRSGIIGREYCCLCWRKITEAAARTTCPGCGKQRILQDGTGRCVLCSRACTQCGHPVRRSDAVLCRDCRRKARQAGRPAALPAVRPPGISARGHRLVRHLLPAPPAQRPAAGLRAMRAGQTP